MNRQVFTAIAAIALALLATTPARAQATRTWVSGVGDDANPCSRTAPCKTFAGAISKTATNGEINCLDQGAFGAITITKSISIDCHETFAGVLASGTTGVTINVAPGNANDPRRTVRLRNLNISGSGLSGSAGTRTGIRGINILSAAVVLIDDLQISDFINEGIRDARSGGGDLYITNTTVRNNNGTAVVVAGTSPFVNATLENVRLFNSAIGVAVTTGNVAIVKRSVIAGNTTGVEADSGSALAVDDSAIANNDNGVQTLGQITLSNNDITRNATAFINNSAFSHGNNRIQGNTVFGTAVTAAGGVAPNFGQQ